MLFCFKSLFKRTDESKDTVDGKKYARDKDNDVETVTECEHNTDDHRENGKYDLESVAVFSLKYVQQSYDTLNGDKNAEDEQNDLCSRPAENEDSDTYDKAYGAARPVLLDEIKNTRDTRLGNDRCGHRFRGLGYS